MAYPDNVFDKRSIGIPEDILLVRQQVKDLRDQAEALVREAERVIEEAAEAEAERKRAEAERARVELERVKAEHARVEAEYERMVNYLRMMERIEMFHRELSAYQRAIDALAAFHDERDYMVLGSALHTRNGVGTKQGDGFKFNKGTSDGDGGLAIAGDFYGLEDDKWLN